MRSIRRVAALPLLVAALALAACDTGGPGNRRILLDQLANREAYWAANGSANYTVLMIRDCFCDDDDRKWQVSLDVVNNEVVSGMDTFDNVELTEAELALQYTITDVFDIVRDALNRGAATVNIAYNIDYGYVEQLYVDYNPRRSDDDLILTVGGYTPATTES
jgi:hypothetical protein